MTEPTFDDDWPKLPEKAYITCTMKECFPHLYQRWLEKQEQLSDQHTSEEKKETAT